MHETTRGGAGTRGTRWTARGAVAAWLLAGAASVGSPVEPTAVVRELLNQEYGPELVSVPCPGKAEGVTPGPARAGGPRGPVAAQISTIEFGPGARPETGAPRLWFIVDELKPLVSTTYTLSAGDSKAGAAATDLKLVRGQGSVEISTTSLGVRLPLGEASAPAPLRAGDDRLPGPTLAVRVGNGAWSGGSVFTGDVQVTRWKSELTDAGPVFARVLTTYTFADSNEVTVAATVVAGDNAVRWDMWVRHDGPGQGVEWRLAPLPGVQEAVLPKGYGQWAKDRKLALTPSSAPFAFLSPDSSIVNVFPDCPPTIRLVGAGVEWQLASREPGIWAQPVAPLTYAGFRVWELDSIALMWEVWKRQRLAVSYLADGTVTLGAPLVKGTRRWVVSSGAPKVGDRLDAVKDLVLDWPAGGRRHPSLFVDRAEIDEAWARAATDKELMAAISRGGSYAGSALQVLATAPDVRKPEDKARVVESLRSQLAKLGNFDVMRQAIGTATLYDALIDSDLVTAEERSLFRSQMAFLAYLLADPRCWSMERGYLSGNPNMSCSYTLSLGIAACVLADHPMARAWADRATGWMDRWLTDEVGENGEWMPEGSHYSYVSLSPILVYAVAAQRAGFHDFSADPRLKKMMLFFAKHQTPRDPQRRGVRVTGAYGRGTSGDALGVFGLAARLYAKSDSALSRTMQWAWAQNGYPLELGDGRLGGCEGYCMDRRLPAEAPAWGSESFPGIGQVLRAGFDTPHESYVHVLASVQSLRNLDIWTPEVGGLAQWFGRGQPLSMSPTFAIGYADRHELLRNGVLLARNWGAPGDPKGPFGHYTQTRFGAFAALPQADYVRSTFVNTRVDDRDWFPNNLPAFPRVKPATGTNLDWTRQLLFVKDPDPAGPAWLVLRDTVAGGQPTAWQFWTLSEKVGTPEQARDPAAFLADKPGATNVAARELPAGNRYTALGQFGVDVEYYVASPSGTPRHTLRCGGLDNSRVPEYQDLLHLQLPGDGAYVVALFPRPREEAAPAFASLAGDKLIKAAGAWGADYVLLTTDDAEASAEGVSVRGTAASVQQRPTGATLSLGAAGEVRWKDYALQAPAAAGLRVAGDAVTVSLAADWAGGELRLTAPAGLKLKEPAAGVLLDTADGGGYRLTVPKGCTRVAMGK